MKLKTRIFELCPGRYTNLSELAQVMGISVSQIYRVREGKRHINQKFIVGAMRAFPEYKMDELFYFEWVNATAEHRQLPALAAMNQRLDTRKLILSAKGSG